MSICRVCYIVPYVLTFGDVMVEEFRAGGACSMDGQPAAELDVLAVLAGDIYLPDSHHCDDVVVLPAGARGEVMLGAGAHVLVCAVGGALMERLRPYAPDGPSVLAGDEAGPLAARLLAELQRPDHATPLFLEAALCDVMARLARARTVPPITAPLAAAMHYAAEHLARRITVTELAGAARLSVRALSSRFTAELRVTPLEYVRTLRIRRAAQALLETTLDLGQIAQQCGFYDHAHLTRSFHESIGTTPTDYRRRSVVTGPLLPAAR